MKHMTKVLAIVVIALGVAVVAVGVTFITIGATTQTWMKDQMKAEQITLGVPDPDIAKGEVIDTAGEAKRAGDIVRSHRHEIAPTYGDLLGGARYDPTDPTQLTYAQALNLENYLYLATSSFGLTNVAIGSGVALVLVGIALIILTALLLSWRRKKGHGHAEKAETEATA
jgi:uncharacterized membrane protein